MRMWRQWIVMLVVLASLCGVSAKPAEASSVPPEHDWTVSIGSEHYGLIEFFGSGTTILLGALGTVYVPLGAQATAVLLALAMIVCLAVVTAGAAQASRQRGRS